MEVNFAPDLQARIDRLAVETGRAPEKLVKDAMAGYVAELVQTREMLDSRYDGLKSGRVKPIPVDEVIPVCARRALLAARTVCDGLRFPALERRWMLMRSSPVIVAGYRIFVALLLGSGSEREGSRQAPRP
jgi:hypothetical protein